MAKEDLSRAEQYRKERKDRLKKESKKNEKRNATVAKAKSTALKVVAVLVAVAILFGVAVAVVNSTGSTFFRSKVASVGSYKISSVEFRYYYRTLYNQYYQYASQGYNMGFDATKSPDEQKYTADDTTAPATTTAVADKGKETETTKETTTTNYDTWNDFFADATIKQIKNLVILSEEAKKANLSLSEAEEKEIIDQIEEIRASATENGYSLNAYLKLVYGGGVTSKFMEKLMRRDALAQKFTEYKEKELINGYKDEEIQKKYDSDKDKYNFVDYRAVTFTVDAENTEASAKSKANDFVSKVSDENSFEAAADEILIADAIKSAKSQAESAASSGTTADPVDEASIKKQYTDDKNSSLKEKSDYETVKQSGEDVAKWLFDSARKAGDIKSIEVKTDGKISSIVVVYMVKPAYRDESVGMNVRHILFRFETTEGASEPTDEQKAAAKAKADDTLQKFISGDKTEESFGKLATELTEDTGSASNGGLYENVVKGKMVEPFENWCFDSSRKPGDTGIVESTYGYHVMYFVSKGDRMVWNNTIRTELAQADYEKLMETHNNSDEYATVEHKSALKSAKKDAVKYVKQYLYNVKRNSEAQQ